LFDLPPSSLLRKPPYPGGRHPRQLDLQLLLDRFPLLNLLRQVGYLDEPGCCEVETQVRLSARDGVSFEGAQIVEGQRRNNHLDQGVHREPEMGWGGGLGTLRVEAAQRMPVQIAELDTLVQDAVPAHIDRRPVPDDAEVVVAAKIALGTGVEPAASAVAAVDPEGNLAGTVRHTGREGLDIRILWRVSLNDHQR
jgi:hypothetical protein